MVAVDISYGIIISFISAVFALAILPGPDNIYVVVQSALHGKRYGWSTTAGLMSGCVVHTTLVALGVAALLNQNEAFFWGIKTLGACYLFYLAYKAFQSNSSAKNSDHEFANTLSEAYKKGFWMNLLNPKVSLFFLAFFPGFLFSDALNYTVQFYILGGIFILVSTAVFGTAVMLSDVYLHKHIISNRVSTYTKYIQVIVFLGIGITILISKK